MKLDNLPRGRRPEKGVRLLSKERVSYLIWLSISIINPLTLFYNYLGPSGLKTLFDVPYLFKYLVFPVWCDHGKNMLSSFVGTFSKIFIFCVSVCLRDVSSLKFLVNIEMTFMVRSWSLQAPAFLSQITLQPGLDSTPTSTDLALNTKIPEYLLQMNSVWVSHLSDIWLNSVIRYISFASLTSESRIKSLF